MAAASRGSGGGDAVSGDGRGERDEQHPEREAAEERYRDGERCDRWGCARSEHENLRSGSVAVHVPSRRSDSSLVSPTLG
jgi:hypothetical protein